MRGPFAVSTPVLYVSNRSLLKPSTRRVENERPIRSFLFAEPVINPESWSDPGNFASSVFLHCLTRPTLFSLSSPPGRRTHNHNKKDHQGRSSKKRREIRNITKDNKQQLPPRWAEAFLCLSTSRMSHQLKMI
jgi:hypothetical protein